MTRKEVEYIKKLVQDNNNLIKDIYNKTRCEFMSKEQRKGFIEGLSVGTECFSKLVDMEVVNVDLNRMPE